MSEEEFMEEDFPLLVLVDEDGNEHLFELLAELEIESNQYRVLIPLDEEDVEEYDGDDDDDDGEVIILKVTKDEEGNELLSDIDDEAEWELVVEAWQELVDNEDF